MYLEISVSFIRDLMDSGN